MFEIRVSIPSRIPYCITPLKLTDSSSLCVGSKVVGDGVGFREGEDEGEAVGDGEGEASGVGVGETETIGLCAGLAVTFRQINFLPDFTQMNDCPEALAFFPNLLQAAPAFGLAALVGETSEIESAAINKVDTRASFRTF